jgi:hypothetical protein
MTDTVRGCHWGYMLDVLAAADPSAWQQTKMAYRRALSVPTVKDETNMRWKWRRRAYLRGECQWRG